MGRLHENGEGGSDNGLEGGVGRSEWRRPGLPRGVLAGARLGECTANRRGAREQEHGAEAGRAESEAAAHQGENDLFFKFFSLPNSFK